MVSGYFHGQRLSLYIPRLDICSKIFIDTWETSSRLGIEAKNFQRIQRRWKALLMPAAPRQKSHVSDAGKVS